MNNSKKAIKGRQVAKKEQKKINPKLWIIASVVLGVFLIGAILFDSLYERVLVTIDGEKYHQSDLNYYFYTVESQYNYINQFYGGSYWDMPYDETSGLTVRDVAKQEAISTAIYNEIMYKEALAENYTLTTEETDTINTDITNILYEQGLSEKMLKQNGFTGDYLTKMLTKTTLSNRYRQDVIDGLDIDDEAIKAGIKYDDYRQYDIEYLFISTQTTDEAGNSVAMNAEDKKAAFDKINAQYEKAKESDDWSTLLPEGEEELKYQKDKFLESYTVFDEEFEAMMMDMENNSISEVYEAENGYYIVRMINNNSSESYDTEVNNAITAAENEAFQTVYTEDILPKHEYKTNDKALQNLKMGTITLVD